MAVRSSPTASHISSPVAQEDARLRTDMYPQTGEDWFWFFVGWIATMAVIILWPHKK